MARIGNDLKQMVLFSLAGKGGEEARAIIEDLSEQMNISVGYLYKLTDVVRANGRTIRKDAGIPRLSISDQQFEAVRELTTRYDLSGEHAIELAALNGVVPDGQLKSYRYNDWLRAHRQERARHNMDVAPSRRFEAKGPNVLHHFDTTKLEQLHYDDETAVLSWDPRANRKNSRGEKPDSIWLYSLVDDYSRCKYAYLYRSLNQYNHLDFFYRAWAQKEKQSEFPFYGLPAHLYMDKGGGNYALKVLHAIHKLGIHLVPTTPSTSEPFGARKHGKVETVFRQYAEWLKIFQIRPLSWEAAQESLYQYALKLDTKIHSVTHERPFERWLSISAPRHMPDADLYAMLKFDHTERRINPDLTISIDRHLYRLPEKRPFINWIKRKIEIYWEPGRYEKVFAVNGATEIELAECRENLVRPAFSYPREERELTAVEQARAAAAGADHSGMKLFSTDKPKTAYMPKRGQDFDSSRIAEKWVESGDDRGRSTIQNPKSEIERRPSFAPERWLGYVAAARELQERDFLSRPLSTAEQAWLKGIFGGREEIAETELMDVVKRAKLEAEKMGAEG